MTQLRDQNLLNQIARRVKTLREARGITQEQFFFDTKIHIGRVETGRVNLSVSTLAAICQYFEIDLTDFFALPDTGTP